MSNLLESIVFSAGDIEEYLKSFTYTRPGIRHEAAEKLGDQIPRFVDVFMTLVEHDNKVPTFKRFMDVYMELAKLVYLDDAQMYAGIYARAARAYPSIMRDLHMSLKLKESKLFDEVIYDKYVDMYVGVDVAIMQSDYMYGVKLYVNTQRALEYRGRKDFRHGKYQGIILDLPLTLETGQLCGDIYLYSTGHVATLHNMIKEDLQSHQPKMVSQLDQLLGR